PETGRCPVVGEFGSNRQSVVGNGRGERNRACGIQTEVEKLRRQRSDVRRLVVSGVADVHNGGGGSSEGRIGCQELQNVVAWNGEAGRTHRTGRWGNCGSTRAAHL